MAFCASRKRWIDIEKDNVTNLHIRDALSANGKVVHLKDTTFRLGTDVCSMLSYRVHLNNFVAGYGIVLLSYRLTYALLSASTLIT